MARVSVRVPLETTRPAAEAPAQQAAPTQRRPVNKQWVVVAVFGALLILIVAFFLNDRRHLKQQANGVLSSQTTTSSSQDAAAKYGSEVANLVSVPAGITPIANTPSEADLAKLKTDNTIYSSVQTGDVFLIYTQPDKSLFLVVYRPSTKKVVLATIGNTQAGAATTTTTK